MCRMNEATAFQRQMAGCGRFGCWACLCRNGGERVSMDARITVLQDIINYPICLRLSEAESRSRQGSMVLLAHVSHVASSMQSLK